MSQQADNLQDGRLSESCQSILLSVCQTTTDALVVFDEAGTLHTVNAVVEHMFGYELPDIIGKSIDLLLPAFQEKDEQSLDLLSGTYLTRMTTGKHRNGKTFPVEMLVIAFHKQEKPLHFSILRDMTQYVPVRETSTSPLTLLSPRQRQVLKLVAEGYTSREIAEQLMISIKTVETHRANIMTKFKANNVIGLVRIAIEYGLVS